MTGQPVECLLTCGALSDTAGLKLIDFDSPECSIIIGDNAYNYCVIEDQLAEWGMGLRPIRK